MNYLKALGISPSLLYSSGSCVSREGKIGSGETWKSWSISRSLVSMATFSSSEDSLVISTSSSSMTATASKREKKKIFFKRAHHCATI